LYGSSFCFINSHFVHSQSKVEERNQNHDTILSNNLFSDIKLAPLNHDFLFFFGDLNYRIDSTREKILKKIKLNKLEELLEWDQLNFLKKKNRIFANFEEKMIEFPPSYKFDKNSKKYDSSKKQRNPSYTDRILVKSSKKDCHKIVTYKMNIEELTSDHRPVLAEIHLKLKQN
jgi:synaptojanin